MDADKKFHQSALARGWQDTKSGWSDWRFWLAEVFVAGPISVFDPVLGIGIIAVLAFFVWLGASVRAPYKQRDEARSEALALAEQINNGFVPPLPVIDHGIVSGEVHLDFSKSKMHKLKSSGHISISLSSLSWPKTLGRHNGYLEWERESRHSIANYGLLWNEGEDVSGDLVIFEFWTTDNGRHVFARNWNSNTAAEG